MSAIYDFANVKIQFVLVLVLVIVSCLFLKNIHHRPASLSDTLPDSLVTKGSYLHSDKQGEIGACWISFCCS